MMKATCNIERRIARYAGAALCALLFLLPAQAQNQATVSLNLPGVYTASVTPGSTSASITFDLGAVTSLSLNLIVPVDNATFVLLDPSQNTVLTSSDPEVEFAAGSENPNPLPGGIFNTGAVPNPVNGAWTLNFSYPSAPEQTIILATIIADSDIKAGLVLANTKFIVGQEVAVGIMVVDDGTPISGLAPEISITPVDPPGTVETYTGVDDGVDFDGLAGDGIYSTGITFQVAGTYTVSGTVDIPEGNSIVTRDIAPIEVTVGTSPFGIPNVSLSHVNENVGSITPSQFDLFCIDWIQVQVSFSSFAEGDAVVRATLRGANGKEISKSETIEGLLPFGSFNSALFKFTREDVVEELEDEGPLTLARVEIFHADESGIVPGIVLTDQATTEPLPFEQWCRTEGIDIGNPSDSTTGEELTVEKIITDGFISAIKITFPVFVANAGVYTFSFKVIGNDGSEVFVAAANPTLVEGANDVTVEVEAEKFLGVDGPYSVVALLVSGPGGAASLTQLGDPFDASRWQFAPKLNGDLDNDLDVDAADRDIVLEFRQEAALNPGDRRDLNSDGVINILDARILTGLACGVDDCFPSTEGEGEGASVKVSPREMTDRQKDGF